jgi:hypothetical protein
VSDSVGVGAVLGVRGAGVGSSSRVELGAVLARAGEGTVFEVVGHPQWVAKVFHADLKDRKAKCAKVAAMIESAPSGAVQSDGFVVLTWPLGVVKSGGVAVGYVMDRVDTADAVEIHTVSNPSNRLNPLPSAPQWTAHVSWAHLVNVAANLCLAVDVVHRVDAVIGDFQERNILVNDTTRVTLVDCDSMQFTDAGGKQFLCAVGRPEFTAPELAGVDLGKVARQKPSDLFALAVHIHLLLMAGNHPFLRGQWTGGGEQPDAMTLARAGHWAGGPGSPLHTHALAPAVDFLPTAVQRLFERAFTDGAADPAARPSAAQWRTALTQLKVRDCGHGHQVPVSCTLCPWCRIDEERATRKAQRAGSQTQTIYKVGPPAGGPARTAPAPAYGGGSSYPGGAPHFGGGVQPYPSRSASSSSNGAKFVIAAVAAVALIGLIILVSSLSSLSNGGGNTTSAYGNTTTTSSYGGGYGGGYLGGTTTTTTTTTAPLNDSTAFEQLRQLVAADQSYVAASLADRWIPQISSKRPGVVDDGQVYNNVSILQEHQRLRQQYGAKLIWSGDWSTFNGPDWWITIVPITFGDPDGALGWCRQNGLDKNHCYAKLVSTTHPVDGSTVLQN